MPIPSSESNNICGLAKAVVPTVATDSIVTAIKVDNFFKFSILHKYAPFVFSYPYNYYHKLYKYINHLFRTIVFVLIHQIQSDFLHFVI